MGNSSVATLRCAVTSITSLSDERDKSDIKDLEYGLAFIDALQPREFVWDNRPETRTEFDEDGNEAEVEFYSANKGKKDFGFIAQEVRELDNDTLRLVYSENEEKLELSYGKLVLKKKQRTAVLITSGEIVWIRAILVLDQIRNLRDITYVLTLLTMITI